MKITLKMFQTAVKKLEGILREIALLINMINPVELVTPRDVEKHKKNWIARAVLGFFDNPTFTYDEDLLRKVAGKQSAIESVINIITKYESKDEATKFVQDRMLQAANDALLSCKMARAMLDHDDVALKFAVEAKYGLPSEHIYLRAVKETIRLKEGATEKPSIQINMDDYNRLKEMEFDAEEIRAAFIWAMMEYAKKHPYIQIWPVIITDKASAIDVRDKGSAGRPEIVIPTSRKVTGLKLIELIGHEIESHWRSSVNALSIGALKPDDELVYEGLAKTMDVRWGDMVGTDNRPAPYYIIAQNIALSGKSFAETASELDRYLPENITGEARAKKLWIYTYRAFRGISDTSNSACYAFTKDRAYFEGYDYARDLQEQGMDAFLGFSTLGKDAIKKLMAIADAESIKRDSVGCEYLAPAAVKLLLNPERLASYKTAIA
jgi:hypothetical protein